MGIVFKAQDLELEDVVAIKVLSPDLEVDEQELLTRFKREINLNRKIKHPNVARIHDFGTSGDYPYITMEFVPGRDFRTLILDEGPLPPARALSIIRQITLGTGAAHRLGIIHRDLKSQNVMVEDGGAVAILDFGLARGKKSEGITLDSIMIGTPHYMSPEQALGKPTDVRSDLYSIGVMAYEALTGKVPFAGDSPLVIAMKQVQEPVPLEPLERANVPDALRAIVLKALSKNPDERYTSAAELEAELSAVQNALPVTPAEPPARTARNTHQSGVMTMRLARTPSPSPPEQAYTIPATPMAHVPAAVKSAPAPVPAPAPAPAVAATTATVVRAALIDRPPVVLLVDDDAVQRTALGGFVAQFGCKTREARTGQEALEHMLKEHVDLVLMDLVLPDMDGFDVTRIIKSQASTSAIPVVLMAGKLDRNKFAFGIQSGATDFLAKPFSHESMIARLWNILQHRGFAPPEGNEALNTALKQESGRVSMSATHK